MPQNSFNAKEWLEKYIGNENMLSVLSKRGTMENQSYVAKLVGLLESLEKFDESLVSTVKFMDKQKQKMLVNFIYE